jgi:hypothetical protein
LEIPTKAIDMSDQATVGQAKKRSDFKTKKRSYFKAPPRPISELYGLPSYGWVTPEEAALVLATTTGALSTRRSRGEWPPYFIVGRMVRYRMGDLLKPPLQNGSEQLRAQRAERKTPFDQITEQSGREVNAQVTSV